MKPRDYCCCAIPMVNAGIYATLIEQLVVAIVVGALAVGTPAIVGASVPSFASTVLAIVCFAVAGIQILGFIGVSREKPRVYRIYALLHGFATAAAFSVAAVWIIMSATRHNDAKERCIQDFFEGDLEDSQGDALCTIFPWVDIGIMGGLWVILGIFHIYLLVVVTSYGKAQRQDHDDYDHLSTQPLTKDTIPLTERKEPWDSRGSDEYLKADGSNDSRYHHRNPSTASASDVLNEPYQQPNSNYSGAYTPYSDNVHEPSYPTYAYTQQGYPTPVAGTYSREEDPRLGRPPQAQAHPAEGQFGRKTPRMLRD
ncbi:hypothetical protein CC1G_06774 [Coprinopsis cinerea okayama7|uniref:Uncharacterized protein n=1 Tax=Coprinopsis cinerea (strain Okayama-7 / 130 / ATCC MYA-4618 / FGSC 9003) TaxID=240176 RepID=A8N1L5_COPC7|nr:hypothetical protein CC1G_06774 [Coprinopsis cinerea okayama7\|eukprot:XP_001828788.2 hypothetical protein CC1G_06774 [Coprinopsis cinerea okayama7\